MSYQNFIYNKNIRECPFLNPKFRNIQQNDFFQQADSFQAQLLLIQSVTPITTIPEAAPKTPDLRQTSKRARTTAKTPVRERIQTRATTAKKNKQKSAAEFSAANKNKIRRSLFKSIENIPTKTN